MASKEQNQELVNNTISTLNQIATNPSTPRNIRKNITNMITELESKEYSVSVRAANTISLLDDITQDPNPVSYTHLTLPTILLV